MSRASVGGSHETIVSLGGRSRTSCATTPLPSPARGGEYSVRVTLQRVIFDKEDRVKIQERITTPQIYQEVFDNLRQALFIEVNES